MNFWHRLLAVEVFSPFEQIAIENEWRELVRQSYQRDVKKKEFLDLPSLPEPQHNV